MMRDLGAKLVPAAAPDMRPFEDMLHEISQKLDRGAPAADLAAMIRDLGQKLDRGAADAPAGDLAAMIRDLSRHIDERIGQKLDTRSLEEALIALRNRLESGALERFDVKFIEEVADLLAERLDRRPAVGSEVDRYPWHADARMRSTRGAASSAVAQRSPPRRRDTVRAHLRACS